MDGVSSFKEDVSYPVDGIEKTRTTNTFRRNLILSAVGAAAMVGLAAPVVYFTAFSAEETPAPLVAARAEAPEKAAAFAMPPPREVTIQKITTAPRADRIETATAGAALKLLTQDNPRWARADEAGSEALPEPVETAELRAKLEQLREPNDAARATEVAAVSPAVEENAATDATLTGTIPSRAGEEPEQARIGPAVSETDEPAPAGGQMAAASAQQAPKPAEAEASGDELRTVQVTTHVNMRAGPENEAAVLTVLPTGTDVKLIGCDMWCEVDFEGQRGYVYKSFISGS